MFFFDYFITHEIIGNTLLVIFYNVLACVHPQYVLVGVNQKSACSAGRIAYPHPDLRVDKVNHHPDDVPWSPELPVFA